MKKHNLLSEGSLPLVPSCGWQSQTFSVFTRDLWSSVGSLGLFVPSLTETSLPQMISSSSHPAVRRVLVDSNLFHMRVSTNESVNTQ